MDGGRWSVVIAISGVVSVAAFSIAATAARTVSRGPRLSAVAEIGRAEFFDKRLSATGTMSCATCHSPTNAYGPPNDRAVQLGGLTGREQGLRAVPSLRYLDRVPSFAIGPDVEDADNASAVRSAERAAGSSRPTKVAGAKAATVPMVPRGGLFWDGRESTLQSQVLAPLTNPVEMANTDTLAVAKKLRRYYGDKLAAVFGARAVATLPRLMDEALFAIGRFQLEDSSFHPYSSKYDAYLAGKEKLSIEEERGLHAFEDSTRGNCAACHLDKRGADGLPPTFSDYQYEALGVPRNDSLAANRAKGSYDLGLCGPVRSDLTSYREYCGMFRTPSLRNVATRRVFFHNGVYHSLEQVLRFYDFRDTRPELVFPSDARGEPHLFDDLPTTLRRNVDTVDAPFNRHARQTPPMTDADMRDIIAFLRTLTDR